MEKNTEGGILALVIDPEKQIFYVIASRNKLI